MKDQLNAIGNVVIDSTPEEMIGAVLVALTLALAASAIYTLARRRVKDGPMLVTCLVLLASVGSMALGAGFLAERNRKMGQQGVVGANAPPQGGWPPPGPPPGGGGLELHVAQRVLTLADRDRDGTLSTEEATDAAARFLKEADEHGRGPVNVGSLAVAMRESLFPNPPGPGPGPGPRPGSGPGPGPPPGAGWPRGADVPRPEEGRAPAPRVTPNDEE